MEDEPLSNGIEIIGRLFRTSIRKLTASRSYDL